MNAGSKGIPTVQFHGLSAKKWPNKVPPGNTECTMGILIEIRIVWKGRFFYFLWLVGSPGMLFVIAIRPVDNIRNEKPMGVNFEKANTISISKTTHRF